MSAAHPSAASFTETYEQLVKLPEGVKEQVTLIYIYSYCENRCLRQAALLKLNDGTVLNVSDIDKVEPIHELRDAHICCVSASEQSVFVLTDSRLYYRGLLCSRDIESIQGFSAAPWKLTGAVKMRCGLHHVMVLMDDGRVMGWGDNYYNQVAVGDRREVPEPEEVLTDVVDMDAGNNFTAALCKDDAVSVWGEVFQGLKYNKPTKIHFGEPEEVLTDVVDMDAGDCFTAALCKDDPLSLWGEMFQGLKYNKPTKVHIGEQVTSVSCGGNHIMMLGVSGSVYCVGFNYQGQCGNGSAERVATPVRLGDV